MGVTISHTAYAPLSLISASIGFVSFAFTLGTFLKVFWTNLGTFGNAPQEINDILSSLKQGLLEQRRHLRRTRRRLKNLRRDPSHGPGRGKSKVRSRRGSVSDDEYGYEKGGYSSYGDNLRGKGRRDSKRHGRRKSGTHTQMHFDSAIQSMQSAGEHDSLRVLRTTVQDLIKTFRQLEHPFLKPEHQDQSPGEWSTQNDHQYYPEKSVSQHRKRNSISQSQLYSDSDSPHVTHMQRTNRLGHEYRKCGFKERWLWVRRKASVIQLSEVLSRVETRRTAHEVGELVNLVTDIGRDLEDLRRGMEGVDGRLRRVVGVRRVD